jgi:HAD superfamily hydrolase (TIGR01509 family)
MTFRGLIFDFDGLIVDTETPAFDVLAAQYREYGATLLPERWVHALGTHGGFEPYDELEALIHRPVDRDALHNAWYEEYIARVERQPLMPGIRALLTEAAASEGICVALASSSNRSWIARWTEHHKIRPLFDCIRTRDDVAQVKPAPDLFLSAAAGMGLDPSECVVLEDSPNGMRAAAAAGMRCVAVPIPLLDGLEMPPATVRLRSLANISLAELQQRLNA